MRLPRERIGAMVREICQTSARAYRGLMIGAMNVEGLGYLSSESSVRLGS